jgi:hypothetical protein
MVNEFIEEVKKICKLEEDFQQNKTKNKNILMEIVGGHESKLLVITIECYDEDISPLEVKIKGGGKDMGLFGMWVFFKRCRSV